MSVCAQRVCYRLCCLCSLVGRVDCGVSVAISSCLPTELIFLTVMSPNRLETCYVWCPNMVSISQGQKRDKCVAAVDYHCPLCMYVCVCVPVRGNLKMRISL